jgi:translation initiation factor 2 subunit 1
MDNNNCRMYESIYPSAEDLVIVQVKNVAEMGAYVSLLEYNGIEGMILLSELSRRRIRSINKLIRVGRTEVVVVLRVDTEKGYIDLSKRRVSPEDIQRCEEKYNKSKAVHSIMRHVSETCKIPLETLYEQFGWDLYKRFGHAYEAFKLMVKESEQVLLPYNIEPEVKRNLLKNIARRLAPQPVRIRADIEVTCFNEEGIDAIKAALKAGELVGKSVDDEPDSAIKIKLVAPPYYVMMMTSMNKDAGIALMNKSCDAITETIKKRGGDVNIKTAARAVNERDDNLLKTLMETLEKQNQEVSGDDAEEED